MVLHPFQRIAYARQSVERWVGSHFIGIVKRDDIVGSHILQAEGCHRELYSHCLQGIAEVCRHLDECPRHDGYSEPQFVADLVCPLRYVYRRTVADEEHFVVPVVGVSHEYVLYLIDRVADVSVCLGAALMSDMEIGTLLDHVEEVSVWLMKPRAIEIIDDNFNLTRREVVNVPIIGQVAAGQPLLAVENIENYFPIPTEFMPNAETFMLKVKGDSMINAGI